MDRDNQATVHIVSYSFIKEPTEKQLIDCHFLSGGKVLAMEIAIEFINSSDKLQDVLTKLLKVRRTQFICNKFCAYDFYAQFASSKASLFN
jgi:hypothetical protein